MVMPMGGCKGKPAKKLDGCTRSEAGRVMETWRNGGDQGFWGSPHCPGPALACASSVKQAPPSRPGFGEIQSWNTEPLRHKESIPSTGPLEPFIAYFDSDTRAQRPPTRPSTTARPPTTRPTANTARPRPWPSTATPKPEGFNDSPCPAGDVLFSQCRPPTQNYSDSWTSWTGSWRSVSSPPLSSAVSPIS